MNYIVIHFTDERQEDVAVQIKTDVWALYMARALSESPFPVSFEASCNVVPDRIYGSFQNHFTAWNDLLHPLSDQARSVFL